MALRFKFGFVCLVLTAVLLLSACGKKDDSSTADSSTAVSATSALEASTSSSTASDDSASDFTPGESATAQGTGASAATADSAPRPVLEPLPLGTFACLSDEGLYPNDRAPLLELVGSDGQAVFRVNTGSELAILEGIAYLQGGALTFSFETMPSEESFWGSNLRTLTFSVLDSDHLQYTGKPFGLTQREMVFERQQPASADAGTLAQSNGPPPPASLPGGANPGDGSNTDAAASLTDGGTSAASQADSSTSSDTSDISEEDGKIPVVEPDKAPPDTLKKGDSFRLLGIEAGSLVYDALYFEAAPGKDGQSVTLTALLAGDTTLSYTLSEGKFQGQTRQAAISIVERGVQLWLVIAIAAASAALGGVGAVFLVATLKKRKETKDQRAAAAAERKTQRAAAAAQKKEDNQEKAQQQQQKRAKAKEERQAKQQAQKQKQQENKNARLEKKAAKEARVKEKKARAAANKAAKAAEEAQNAAKKAAEAAKKSSGDAVKPSPAPSSPPVQEERHPLPEEPIKTDNKFPVPVRKQVVLGEPSPPEGSDNSDNPEA